MIGTDFHNWQDGRAPGAPFDRYSPNLIEVDRFLDHSWPALEWKGSGFNVRRAKNDDPTPEWSSHAFGAAKDRRYARLGRARLLAEVIPALIEHSAELHVQAIHDYVGARIWRAGRTSKISDASSSWWKPQRPSTGSGMGQPSSLWIHIETTLAGWGDSTPFASRLGTTPPPATTPTPTPGGVFMHETIRFGDVSADVFSAQLILRLKAGRRDVKADGKFGPITDRAIRDFQSSAGLKVDGIVGPVTWRAFDALANA